MVNKIIIYPFNFSCQLKGDINGINFSTRETDVIACLLQGRPFKTIASLLSISPKTTENYSRNIMLKIGCNSRDGIINFVEVAGIFKYFRQHYEFLSFESQFKKYLNQIQSEVKNKNLTCIIFFENIIISSFKETLKKHLEFSGFKSVFKKANLRNLSSQISKQISDPKILILSSEEIRTLSESSFDKKLLEQLIIIEFKNEMTQFQIISEENSSNGFYPIAFLKLLKELHSEIDIEPYIQVLNKKFHSLNNPLNYNNPKKEPKLKYKKSYFFYLSIFFITVLLIGLIGYKIYRDKLKLTPLIHSELALPTKDVLLERSKLKEEIHQKLKENHGIKTIALVGCGGAGKTTLARSYANTYSHPVTWEINAETHESLIISFENLALSLAITENEKKTIKNLQEIKDSQEREQILFSFLKSHLKENTGWLLIFDNVETFSDIQSYFPYDTRMWGVGKVIVTTRDENIQNNNSINHTMRINELETGEKEKLFLSIMELDVNNKRKEQIRAFLTHIPPFPLDTSVAAYYIKATNISYNQYVQNLKQHQQEFADLQKDILKNASKYSKTRYEIISMSVKKLIETHKDFADILFFISLLDSQDIPRDLLNAYKGSIIVDNFFYHLKKHSLITSEINSSHSTSSFSIHRSTQEIIFAYLIKALKLEKANQLLQSIVNTLETYLNAIIDKEDFLQMRHSVGHYESFLRHKNMLSASLEGVISLQLGHVYYHLGEYVKAKDMLERISSNTPLYFKTDYNRIAQISSCLGIVYRELGNYKKAEGLLEKSYTIYLKYLPSNYKALARNLTYLGIVHRYSGQYEKARDSLHRGYLIYEKYCPDSSEAAWNLVHLANAFRSLGSYHKARNLLENAIVIHKKLYGNDHLNTAWASVYLAAIYEELGEYEKAMNLLEYSLSNYKQFYSTNHADIGWTLVYLGSTYRNLGYYEKSYEALKEALKIHEQSYGDNNTRTAWSYIHLGNLKESLGHYKEAKILYEKAFKIHQENFANGSLVIAWNSLRLGSVYSALKDYKNSRHLLEKSSKFYEKLFGRNHIEYARVINSLGNTCLLAGNYKEAENLLNEALKIFMKYSHPSAYITLEILAELYFQNSLQSLNKKDVQQSQKYKAQAMEYLRQALEIVKSHLPKNSPHKTRIQEKLKSLNSKLI